MYSYGDQWGDYVTDPDTLAQITEGELIKKNGKVPTPGKPSPDRNNDSENLRLQEILEARSLNKLHAALVSNKPVIKVGAKTNLTTNPRWKYPVLDWWKNNVLIDDAVHGNGNSNGSGSKRLYLPA